MRRVSIAIVSTVGAAAALLAGCGGDDGLEKSELQRKAQQICAKADDRLLAIPAPRDTAATVQTARRTIRITQRAIDQLAELDPSGDVEDDYEGLLDDLREQQKLAQQLIGATERLDSAAAAKIIEADEELRERTAERTQRIGIEECVRP